MSPPEFRFSQYQAGGLRNEGPAEAEAGLQGTSTPSPALNKLAKLPACVQHLTRGANAQGSAGLCPVMSRRAAGRRGTYTLSEIAQHKYVDDAWICVDGAVYDVTDHLINHPGWEPTGDTTTPLSILAHAGMDCTAEFHSIHRPYPLAYKQLPAFRIGDLAPDCAAQAEQ